MMALLKLSKRRWVSEKMTRQTALRILGIRSEYTVSELKKKYKELMLMTHPDMQKEAGYPYDASEINVAYEYLLKNQEYKEHRKEGNKKKKHWNAPINSNAYAPRKIFHPVEDIDGMQIGLAVLDIGKYIWTKEEDFPLFLKSLYQCSKSIIASADEKNDRNRQNDITLLSEITYLLAGQFVDSDMVLKLLSKGKAQGEKSAEDDIYLIDAMLEMSHRHILRTGEILYPSKMSHHRLMVRNKRGEDLGYISFKDDRLYYGIIPMLEQRKALVKMIVHDNIIKRSNGKYYIHVDMQIKKYMKAESTALDSVNMRIDALLNS